MITLYASVGNYNQIKVYEVCARGFVIIADSIVMGKNTPYRKEKAKRKCKKTCATISWKDAVAHVYHKAYHIISQTWFLCPFA
ncbi:MAG TPA: hypothetical protein DEQ17_01595 [Prevotella sp.]|nr:hypothetical protein [Prevotella sp.]